MSDTAPRHRSAAPERRDGHVLHPCGCWWNRRLKVYSKRCSDSDGRTTTPPHGVTVPSPVKRGTLAALIHVRRKK